MTSFDWNLFEKGWLEVNCKNEELASDFISKCAKKGIKWLSGNEISPLDVHTWLKYKENTVYGLYDGKMYLKIGTKTLTYPIVTQNIVQAKFKLI